MRLLLTFTHTANDRQYRNARRDRTDEEILARLRQVLPTPPLGTPDQVAAAIAQARASDQAVRARSARQAADIALGCLWADAEDYAEDHGLTLLDPDEVTVTVTVKDLVATASMSVPGYTPVPGQRVRVHRPESDHVRLRPAETVGTIEFHPDTESPEESWWVKADHKGPLFRLHDTDTIEILED